jgi:hypothetical protein
MHVRTVSRLLAAGVMVGALGLQAVPAAADATHTYVALGGDATGADCAGAPVATPDQGGSCFVVGPGTVDVVITDASGQKVNGQLSWQNSTTSPLPTSVGTPVDFCGSVTGVAIPDKADTMFVSIGDYAAGGLPFPPAAPKSQCGGPAAATEGTIAVTGSGSTGSRASAARRSNATDSSIGRYRLAAAAGGDLQQPADGPASESYVSGPIPGRHRAGSTRTMGIRAL